MFLRKFQKYQYERLRVEHWEIVQMMNVMVYKEDNARYVKIDGKYYRLRLLVDDVWTTGC